MSEITKILPYWKNSPRTFRNYCCRCTPLCTLFSILAALLLAILIATTLTAVLVENKSSATSTITSTSSTASTTSSTSKLMPHTDQVNRVLRLSIGTTTTTPSPFSCLNQTWISSAGLLAKWTFDGTFLDETNTYNATAVNSPSFLPNGYVNQALILSAASKQYLYASYIPLVNTSFTIEAWLYPTGFPNPTDHSILGLCTNPWSGQCLHLTIRNVSGAYHLYMSFYGDNCVSNVTVSLNQWIHAAFVFDLASFHMLIYQDGVFAGACTSALPLQGIANNVTIGYVPGIVAMNHTNFSQVGSLSLPQFFSIWNCYRLPHLGLYWSFDRCQSNEISLWDTRWRHIGHVL